MKKTKFLAVALASVALAAMLSLAACGGQQQAAPAGDAAPAATDQAATGGSESAGGTSSAASGDASNYVGTWTLAAMTDAQGNEVSLEDYAAANGTDVAAIETTYEFAANGTVTMNNALTGALSAEWAPSSAGVAITTNGVTTEMTLVTLSSGAKALTYTDPSTGMGSVFVQTA